MGPARTVAIVGALLAVVVIAIAVAFPYVLITRMMEYNRMFVVMRTPRATVSEAYSHLNTGDILLFVTATNMPFNSGFTQSFYSHTAMLMREGDLVYTSEAQLGTELMPDPNRPGVDHHMKPGAAAAPMLTRVKYYTGSVYVMRLSRALDPGREQRLKAVADQLHAVGYPYPTAQQAFSSTVLRRRVAARHCFQHVAHLLDAAGLTPLDRAAPLADSGFIRVVRDVCELPGRALPDGYRYEPPVQLVYDIGTLSLGPAQTE